MKKILLLFMVCFTVSVASAKQIKDIDNSVKKVRIGMKKKKVISIMGDNYEIILAKEGVIVLGYTSSDKGLYKLFFEDEKLKELNKEKCKNWFRAPLNIPSSIPVGYLK